MPDNAQPPGPPSDVPARSRGSSLPAFSSMNAGDSNPFLPHASLGLEVPGYAIMSELGRGGQAVVYQAIQKSTHRHVALKVLREGPYASASAKQRFEREVELVSHLRHPNIIVVFDSGITTTGQLYYVMDYVRGVPITQYVRDNKLSLEKVLELFAVTCDAVNHAHQKGVIHRDLKPSNLLVDTEGNLRILDFGLAKAVADRQDPLVTVTGQIMGTLPYMSPEQTRGNPDLIDTRTDVYALGVVLYEMLTGAYPYPVAGEMAEVLRHIATTEPMPLTRSWTKESGIARSPGTRTRSGCPINDEVDTIVLKALAKERERRYQSAGDVAEDVRHYLANEPIEAKHDSGMYILRKTLRRYRVPVAVVGLIAAILVISSVVAWTQRNQAVAARGMLQTERDRANENASKADRSASEARDERNKAEQRLATSLVLEGDAFVRSGRPSQARSSYVDALKLARQLNLPESAERGGWLESCETGIPLMGSDGSRLGLSGFFGHQGEVTSVAFSPDGRTALSGSDDNMLKLWDVSTGKEIRSFVANQYGVHSVAFSPDGRTGMSGGYDPPLKLWDVSTGKEIRSFVGHQYGVYSVAFSPDGRTALSGGYDKMLKLWDVSTGREIRGFVGHQGQICSVAFSPDGRMALSGSRDNTLKLWDVSTGGEIRSFSGHRNWVNSVAFSPDGRMALSGSSYAELELWDVSTGREIRSFVGHQYGVYSVAFSPDGRTALSGSDDNMLKLWDVSTGKEIRSFVGHQDRVLGVAFSPDGRTVLSGSADNMLKLWGVSTGRETRSFVGHQGWVGPVAFSPDGRTALSGGEDNMLKLWDVSTGKEIRSFAGHQNMVCSLAFSPDGRTALSGSDDKMLKVWDVSTGKEIRSFVEHRGRICSVAFSPDGRMALSASWDRTLKLWDVSTGREIRSFSGHRSSVDSVAFSPDGRTALSGSDDNMLKLWDVSTGKEIRSFSGHRSSVDSVAFSPDGRTALSGSGDNTLKLWDVSTGKEIRSFVGHQGTIHSVAFSPDGRMALSAGLDDRALKLWDFSRMDRYLELEPRVVAAREALAKNPDDPQALLAFGEWWAFRGFDDWAVEFFEKARAKGGDVSAMAMARCYWKLGKLTEARREFDNAIARKEAPEQYLVFCRDAVQRELDKGMPTTVPVAGGAQ